MVHKPDVIKLPLDYYVNKLRNNEPFTFARYGDGEWLTILGYSHLFNSNGCSFTPELAKALQQTIQNQNDYQYALLQIARRTRGDEIVPYLTSNNIAMDWYNGDLFLDLLLKGKLFPLIEQIRERRVLYIGNYRLRDLNMRRAGFFSYVAFIEPLVQNAYEAKDEILREVYRTIRKNNIDFIGWSSGLAAKYFIDQVYMRHPEITQLDCGSMFDGFFKPLKHIQDMGRNGSRSYIRKGGYDWQELCEMNTDGEYKK